MASTGLDGKLECSGMTEKRRGKAGGKEFLHQYKTPECALSGQEIEQFRRDLLGWFAVHQRTLPWRETRDPYRIWVSEIMLQQTRVAAVLPYYQRFVERFPDVRALASASEPELLGHWAGLGYYYRARNMQQAARLMQERGSFPATYQEIRDLPGVGDYTAAAISSIAFDLPHAALDGNVLRVLSRVLDERTNIASGIGRRRFAALAQEMLDSEHPGAFNQAMMELGATVCLPKNPQCLLCPVAQLCRARASCMQNELPVKAVRTAMVQERRAVFWIERGGKLLLWQRPPTARLMPGFWELPEAIHLPGATPGAKLASFRHGITFHSYSFEVREATAPMEIGECQWVALSQLGDLPASTIVKKARRSLLHVNSARLERTE
jgi:A/G-specific adenine glycosylase